MHCIWVKPLYLYDDIVQLEVCNVYSPQTYQPRGLIGSEGEALGVVCRSYERGHSTICLFPALRLIVAPIPVHMGAQFYSVIQRVIPRSEAYYVRRCGRSDIAGLVACPVNVSGPTSRATVLAADTAARLYIPDAAFSTGVLRSYNSPQR